MFTIRKSIVAGVALTAAVGLGTVAAAPATADTVSVSFSCAFAGAGHWTADYLVTITAPATATRGQAVTVTAALGSIGTANQDAPAGAYRAFMDISLGGAASGTITANGLTSPAVRVGDPLPLTGGVASVTFNAVGDVTYRPVRFVSTNRGFGCGVLGGGSGPVTATTRVS